MTTEQHILTAAERRQITRTEIRKALGNISPAFENRYTGQQIAAAKGIGRKRAMKIIDRLGG